MNYIKYKDRISDKENPEAFWNDYADSTSSHGDTRGEEAERKLAFYAGIESQYRLVGLVAGDESLSYEEKKEAIIAFRMRTRALVLLETSKLPPKAESSGMKVNISGEAGEKGV